MWRERNRLYDEHFKVPKLAFGGSSISVLEGRIELVSLRNAAKNSRRYKDMVIKPLVMPFTATVGKIFLLVDGNARLRCVHIVNDCINFHGNRRVNWPPRSPDMNCIEHV